MRNRFPPPPFPGEKPGSEQPGGGKHLHGKEGEKELVKLTANIPVEDLQQMFVAATAMAARLKSSRILVNITLVGNVPGKREVLVINRDGGEGPSQS